MNPPDHLVLFDGVCNFCTASVQFMLRHDRRGLLRFASIQSELGRSLYRSAGLDPDRFDTLVVFSGGRVLVRSDAALEIATHFGGLWRLCGVFRWVPRGLRDRVYAFIAHRRYRWFGKSDACFVPTPEVRRRFVS